jgi:hypothetical protein
LHLAPATIQALRDALGEAGPLGEGEGTGEFPAARLGGGRP